MRKLLPAFILFVFCLPLLALPVYAQEATAEPTAEATTGAEATEAPAGGEATAAPPAAPEGETGGEAPTGLSTLMLLIGLGAVALVGLSMVARDNLRNNKPADKS